MRYLALIVSLLAVSPAAFADRYVWVNGQRMGPSEVAYLERLRCGPISRRALLARHPQRHLGLRGQFAAAGAHLR